MVKGIFTDKAGTKYLFESGVEVKKGDTRFFKNEMWNVKSIHEINNEAIAVLEMATSLSRPALFVNAATLALRSYKIIKVVK